MKTSAILMLVGWIFVIPSAILVFIGSIGPQAAIADFQNGFTMPLIAGLILFSMGLDAVSSASSMIIISAIMLVAALIIQLIGVILAMQEMENKIPAILVLVGWIIAVISLILVLIGWMGLAGAYNSEMMVVVLFFVGINMIFVNPFLAFLVGMMQLVYFIMGGVALSSAGSMILISAIILVVAAVIQLVGVILAARE